MEPGEKGLRNADLCPDGTRADPRDNATTTRLASLDSVRGLAALSVVVCHYLILSQNTAFGFYVRQWLWLPPFCLLSTAQGSVILFFVLSGYVLALGLLRENGASWGVFAVRRFCRIWPPYALTIIIAFALFHTWTASERAWPWVMRANIPRGDDISLAMLFNQLGMLSSRIPLDAPGWSLVHELRISLALPLVLIFLRRAPGITILVSLCLHLARQFGPPWLSVLVPGSATYIIYFALGAWLALNRDRILRLRQITPLAKTLLCVMGLIFLSVPVITPCSGILAGVGAMLILATVTASPGIARALSASWCEFLGRISYSLYLTHVVVLLALLRLLGPFVSIGWILALATPIIGVVAMAGYHWMERPSIRLGQKLAIHLRQLELSPTWRTALPGSSVERHGAQLGDSHTAGGDQGKSGQVTPKFDPVAS